MAKKAKPSKTTKRSSSKSSAAKNSKSSAAKKKSSAKKKTTAKQKSSAKKKSTTAKKTTAKKSSARKKSTAKTAAAKTKSTTKAAKSNDKPVKLERTLAFRNKPHNFRGKKKVYFERLMELRQSLIEEVELFSDSALTFEHQAGEELADIGSESFQREMELGMMTIEEEKIQLIQDAVERLDNGDYGVCLDCDEKIPEGRLEALPYAKLCVQCKSRREQREALGLLESDELTE